MPKSTLSLKATVTPRDQAAGTPDMKTRLAERQHHQAAVSAEPGKVKPQQEPPPKQNPHALQNAFLADMLDRVVTIYLLNGVKVVGTLKQFDQYTLLLQGTNDPLLVFKHALGTLQPARHE